VRKWLVVAASVLLALGLSGLFAYRYYYGDRARSLYCRVALCPDLDALDDLCALFSEAELSGLGSRSEALSWIRDEAPKVEAARALPYLDAAMAQPPESRYAWLRGEARREGAPRWSCPPIERALTTTTSDAPARRLE
jgi:hypothetical protein